MVAHDQAQIIGVLEFYFKVFALRIHTRLLTNCIDVYNVNGTFGLKKKFSSRITHSSQNVQKHITNKKVHLTGQNWF